MLGVLLYHFPLHSFGGRLTLTELGAILVASPALATFLSLRFTELKSWVSRATFGFLHTCFGFELWCSYSASHFSSFWTYILTYFLHNLSNQAESPTFLFCFLRLGLILYKPGCPGTQPASASQLLGIIDVSHHAWWTAVSLSCYGREEKQLHPRFKFIVSKKQTKQKKLGSAFNYLTYTLCD